MFTSLRSLYAPAVALALAVPFALPAAAAAGKVCYFGECVPDTPTTSTAAIFAPSAPTARVVGQHGSWVAVVDGQTQMIIDRFDDGSAFAIANSNGKMNLVIYSPKWSLADGDTANVKITVDGADFSGTVRMVSSNTLGLEGITPDFLRAIYNGHKAHVATANYAADMSLSNAQAAIDDIDAYLKTAQR
jgi:hypothetical protein